MTSVVTLKLTKEEIDLLDWLVRAQNSESRSQAVRQALRAAAERSGIRQAELDRVTENRANHVPRRAVKFTRLIGPRRKGEEPSGGIV